MGKKSWAGILKPSHDLLTIITLIYEVSYQMNAQDLMLLNILRPKFKNVYNKLECLSLASLSSLVECFQVRLGSTRVKYF
jgi:hypothetical protein